MFNRSPFNRTPYNRASGSVTLAGVARTRMVGSVNLIYNFTIRGRARTHTVFHLVPLNMWVRLRALPVRTYSRETGQLGIEHIESLQRAMNSPTRDILGRVEITYTDPFNDYSLEFSANQQAYNSHLPDVADGQTTPLYKWFNLTENKLDGSYHPIDALHSRSGSVGWWGTSISDANGYFSGTLPELTISFSSRALLSLSVSGDSKLESYPVDFVIRAYNEAGDLLHTETVTGNTEYTWSKNIDRILGVVRVTLTVSRINKPNNVVRITEFFTTIREIYENETIVSIDLLEEIGYNSGTLPIGNISANEVDITLNNFDRRFDLNNTDSTLYGYVKRNRQVRVWLGALVYGKVEWAPLGTFWTTQWDIRKDSLTVTLTARDKLDLLRRTDFEKTPLFINRSLAYLFERVLQDAGLLPNEYIIDPQLNNVIIPRAWFPKMSHRDALQRLAGCAIVQVYCTKDNKIAVSYGLTASPEIKAVMDDDVNVIAATYPLAVSEQVNVVEVTRKIYESSWTNGQGNTPVYDSKEPIVVPPGRTLIPFLFNKVPVMSLSWPTLINPPAGVSIDNSGQKAYTYGMDIMFVNTTGVNQTVQVEILGEYLEEKGEEVLVAEDPAQIQEDGRISQSVAHEFIQDRTYAQQLADTVLNTFKASRYDVVLENRGDATIQLGDRMVYVDGQTRLPYLVARQQIHWDGALSATTEGKRLME